MRKALIAALSALARREPRIVLLTGDLGYTVVEPFREEFPERFFNAGVAEQNMVGMATGLAESGFIPFVYSIATFAALRPYEFIRNGPVLHRLPVRILGIGAGFEYGSAGPTHHALEDLAALRPYPGLTLVCPADCPQAQNALLKTWDLPGPVYYRLSKNDQLQVPELEGRFDLARTQVLRNGEDLLFIALGTMAANALAAAEALASKGVQSTVLALSSFNPSPDSDLAEWLSRFSLAISVESHSVSGGAGSLISEIIAERALNCRLVRCGVRTPPDGLSGSTAYLEEKHGISGEALARTALREMEYARYSK